MAHQHVTKASLSQRCEQVEHYDPKASDKHTGILRKDFQKIWAELKNVCQDVLDVEMLVPKAESCEWKVHYYKMKGDYHRYLAEVSGCPRGL